MAKLKLIWTYLKAYFWNILVWLDQGINVIFLLGDPDETVSSRCAKLRDKNKVCYYFCKFLDWIDKDHSDKSLEEDEGDRNVIQS